MLSPDVLYTSKKSPAAMEKLTSSARSDGLMSGNVTCIVWSLLLMLLLHWCTHGYRRKSSTSLHLPRLCYKGKGQILTIYMLQNKESIYIQRSRIYTQKYNMQEGNDFQFLTRWSFYSIIQRWMFFPSHQTQIFRRWKVCFW